VDPRRNQKQDDADEGKKEADSADHKRPVGNQGAERAMVGGQGVVVVLEGDPADQEHDCGYRQHQPAVAMEKPEHPLLSLSNQEDKKQNRVCQVIWTFAPCILFRGSSDSTLNLNSRARISNLFPRRLAFNLIRMPHRDPGAEIAQKLDFQFFVNYLPRGT
jgi:hypothetical protein